MRFKDEIELDKLCEMLMSVYKAKIVPESILEKKRITNGWLL